MIIIIMFYCDCEDLTLCSFSLELSKMLYLQTVQTNITCVLSWKDILTVIPKFDLFHGFVTQRVTNMIKIKLELLLSIIK